MDQQWTESSVFRPATTALLDRLDRRIAEQRCTFLMSSNYINAASTKLAYLISSSLTARGGAEHYLSFLINSTVEALSGAVKLARQTSVRARRDDGGWVLLLDAKGVFASFVDPTSRGVEEAITPHVVVVPNAARAVEVGPRHTWSAVVVVRDASMTESFAKELEPLLRDARARGSMVVLCDSELEPGDDRLFTDPLGADVIVYGENLGGGQVPFGCFAMTEKAYEVWNNDVDCYAQTSTFGGNTFCADVVLATLDAHGLIDAEQRGALAVIDADREEMRARWARYINPAMGKMEPIFGLDLEIDRATGARLHLDDGREILDCSGGFGSNFRGHNPPDVPAEVLAAHRPDHDYYADLEEFLTRLTGFDRAFPAVSGATAVDQAAALALLANRGRTRVVTFTGNFAGKSLFAINLSKHGPQVTESDDEAFRPYYHDLVYVDPFADDAVGTLEEVLGSGEVALVWFEIIRGGLCQPLPEEILRTVERLRASGGYLVGVDEVLTGGWRAGDDYLAHRGMLEHVDLVAVGKAMSDMLFPMSSVLCTQEVYDRAMAADPGQVRMRSRHFRTALGAHIAHHALEKMTDEVRWKEAMAAQRVLEDGIRRFAAASRIFGTVDGQGAMLRLRLRRGYFPFDHRSKFGVLLEMAAAQLIFERSGIFVFLLRFLHRTVTTEEDAREVVRRLEVGMRDVRPRQMYRFMASRMLFAAGAKGLSRLVAGRLARPRHSTGN
ncbi:aminotransferase class III-fold pyridoxal phosphate-dependent enzyme [Streptomyces profundus]|uniref:aminotransferase class III-fold pyridoxal phosphate-dependent enzyme n=1 Tax=Streptomyces profundus TaxID=2867410 RepID=UPI001D165BB0|nr:aminotransferase class III-fold pyridoxal phosphate-dependent enzyme [Streptomyces sp. MA3_2.13]UED88028.1 aminotransferase class III-fold pyridoxal phosphate-dependent enzyme [Streptomyces sp. MA3_2.13]